MEREAEKMQQESDRVGGRIEESRGDWESKEGDQSVPGAQPDAEEELGQEIEEQEQEERQERDAE
jgi:hypothetical protein